MLFVLLDLFLQIITKLFEVGTKKIKDFFGTLCRIYGVKRTQNRFRLMLMYIKIKKTKHVFLFL